jgi:hypothetical protein
VADITSVLELNCSPQLTMQGIINEFERLRPTLEELEARGAAIPLEKVRLGPRSHVPVR